MITWASFDDALIGFAERCTQPPVAIYDLTTMIETLVNRDGLTYEEAQDHIDFNYLSGWVGQHTPLIITLRRDEMIESSGGEPE
jgi:hypothetical protein